MYKKFHKFKLRTIYSFFLSDINRRWADLSEMSVRAYGSIQRQINVTVLTSQLDLAGSLNMTVLISTCIPGGNVTSCNIM